MADFMSRHRVFITILSFSVVLSAYFINENKNNYDKYIPAKAIITHIRPARLTNYGIINTQYDIRFIANDGKQHNRSNCHLVRENYSVNDTLTIYYNPDDFDDPITDKEIVK
jgi:hypothetical protein